MKLARISLLVALLVPNTLCAFVIPEKTYSTSAVSMENVWSEAIDMIEEVKYHESLVVQNDVSAMDNIPQPAKDFWKKVQQLEKDAIDYSNYALDEISKRYNIADKVASIRKEFDALVVAINKLEHDLKNMTHTSDIPFEHISDKIQEAIKDIIEKEKKAFPPTDEAPRHEERSKRIGKIMHSISEAITDILKDTGLSEEKARSLIGDIEPIISRAFIIIGDVVEQHPALIETIVISFTILIIPEGLLLGPFLRLFGFGPLGPIKGSIAAWAQRYFWGAAVREGSWFAFLQSAAMKAGWARRLLGTISSAVGVGLAFGFGGMNGCFGK